MRLQVAGRPDRSVYDPPKEGAGFGSNPLN